MNKINEILDEIINYTEWFDRDSSEELKIYLIHIRELTEELKELLIKNEI